MPRHCSAGGCKSRDNRETRNAGITFHKLPKGASRRNLWITNSHRADSWDPQTDFVYFCSKHFTPESFELTGCSGIRRLKEDALPTVFDSSSVVKSRGPGPPQTPQDIPVRKNPCLLDQEKAQQDTDTGQTSDVATAQRSVAAAEDITENIPASSQEPSADGVEQLSQQECSLSPAPGSRSLSPSCYMRRLPPPPGFYLPKEHSYAQLCPLLWRRRYNQAIDCLEKALRQLHAARRRENRLRMTVLRLRDKRLRHTLLVSQDGCKKRVCRTPERERRRGKGGSNQVESDTNTNCDDTGLFEDLCVDDQMELGNQFLQDTNNWSEEEKGYCFYCGKGQAQVGGQVACRVSKNSKDVQLTVHGESMKIQKDTVEASTCCTAEHVKDRTFVKSVENVDLNSQVLPQAQGLQHVLPAGVTVPDPHKQSLQLGSQQKLLLSDMCEGENETLGQENHLDLPQHQLFWIQDITEGQVILVPVSAEDGLQSYIKMEEVPDEAQTILVSEVDLKGDEEDVTGDNRGLSRVETGCDDEHSEQQSVIDTTPGEDVREKLKEHLEGFHLQLSTEFIN